MYAIDITWNINMQIGLVILLSVEDDVRRELTTSELPNNLIEIHT